ncbi:exodeoxyribonuclease III [Trichonephila inaurata madagascariensis]|uniref:DNA-(apurinic or apyrimidinic site) endonuclease n=1 Tax=Trichonephila inaurata madagascariensis TaxID=2747483 RepID=A0A8X7CT10_9ARAC|nr:exodeoxyribonuclease III [Trichonephila inaurata madagascariensis]
MKSILLTRPLLDSFNTRNILRKYGYKVFIEPVFTIKYLNPDISAHEFDVVISTSKNSVKAFSQICKEDDFPIITVGNSTMQAAKNLGFADIISADSNVDGLISFIKAHYSNAIKFLYIRGQEVSCDLKKRLSEEDFNVREVVLYKTIIKRSLTHRCKNLLLDGKIDGVAFFSSQTARIATWNVNSIRKRVNQLCSFIVDSQIDIVLLQEIKCTEEQFPYAEIEKLGYEYAIYGQVARNGVCVLSKYPILEKLKIDIVEGHQEARYIECVIKHTNQKVRVGSVYVPNGQSLDSQAFEYKLKFFDNLYERMSTLLKNEELTIIAGDYNVALDEIDVFDSNLLNGQVCFHIKEHEKLRAILNLGFKDAFRISHPNLQQFTWWHYQGNSLRNNQGMRIDYMLLSPQAADKLETCYIDDRLRKLENPSDHTPVVCIIKQ